MTLRVRTVIDRPYGEVCCASPVNGICRKRFGTSTSAVPYNTLCDAYRRSDSMN